MVDIDDAALEGGEQTPAPAPAPAPSEHVPGETTKQTVRAAYEKAQAKATERDERERAPRAPAAAEADDTGQDPGKPTLDRTRDPHGRFVRGQGQEQVPAQTPAIEAPESVEQTSPAPAPARAPSGWNAAARAQYPDLSQEVKDAVAKREVDFSTGIQAKDRELQHYRGLETYTPAIEASGLSHAEFTKRAVEWEQSLASQPLNTALHATGLAAQRATDPVERQILQVHYQALAQAMQQRGRAAPQLQVQQQAPQPQQDWRALARQEARQEFAEREAHATVDEFLTDPKNIHAEAVADDMAFLITNGRADTLEEAYDKACNMHPEIRALLIRQAGAIPDSVSETERARRRASEARAAAKATVGAPSGPRPDPKEDRPSNAPVRYDVRKAYQQVLDRQT